MQTNIIYYSLVLCFPPSFFFVVVVVSFAKYGYILITNTKENKRKTTNQSACVITDTPNFFWAAKRTTDITENVGVAKTITRFVQNKKGTKASAQKAAKQMAMQTPKYRTKRKQKEKRKRNKTQTPQTRKTNNKKKQDLAKKINQLSFY